MTNSGDARATQCRDSLVAQCTVMHTFHRPLWFIHPLSTDHTSHARVCHPSDGAFHLRQQCHFLVFYEGHSSGNCPPPALGAAPLMLTHARAPSDCLVLSSGLSFAIVTPDCHIVHPAQHRAERRNEALVNETIGMKVFLLCDILGTIKHPHKERVREWETEIEKKEFFRKYIFTIAIKLVLSYQPRINDF